MDSILNFILILIRDILVNAIGSLLGGLAILWLTVGTVGIKSIRARFGRPSIEIKIKRAPSNIFAAVQIGASAEWVKQNLGHPLKVGANTWGYRFSDALVSLQFSDQEAVVTVAVALVDDVTTFDFPTWHFEAPPLGLMTVAHMANPPLNPKYIQGRRHQELLFWGREGTPNNYHEITLGVLDPVFPGALLAHEFEWNAEENTLITPKEELKINWAAISSISGPASFPWELGLDLQS
jgi:hypothetical protein